MHSSSILMATFAAAVSANMERMVVPVPRFGVARAIAARQTDSDFDFATASVDAACAAATDALADILENLPLPPDDLESWAETASVASTDSCDYSVPASLTSEYSAYSSSALEWYSSYSSEVEDVISQCSVASSDFLDMSICTTNADLATGTATGTSGVASVSATTTSSSTKTTTTGTSSSSSSSTKSSSSSSSATSASATAGAAAREVGIVGAVVAGVLGAVVAL